MLKKLRLQLTLLYLFSSILLALLVGGGAYTLVAYYFQSTNDQALKAKMGVTLRELNLSVPADLQAAMTQAGFSYTDLSGVMPTVPPHNESEEDYQRYESEDQHAFERTSTLADIYILPLTLNGSLVTGMANASTSFPVNLEAITAARQSGYDFRTFTNANGIPVRLFTYVTETSGAIQAFQAGRFLSSQENVLQEIMQTMVFAGGVITLLFGLASWILAGRTIKPSQAAFDKQQTFVANASHELRTPLTLIRAGVELSLRKATDPGQRELLADALVDADYMKKLIEELLLLSRLDAQSLKLEIAPVQLDQFLPEIVRKIGHVAEAQQIRIETSASPVAVLADAARLKQVLLIVFDNALRNSPNGSSIEVVARREHSRGIIQITDHGQGVKEKDLEKVFDRFYKVENSSSQEYRGSGLGLSIARSLIAAQNGSITLASEAGQWTCVTISLPLTG
jgi:signal transduction histidine kinase